MNKYTKIGVTALSGALASFAVAEAGPISVAGSVTVSNTSVNATGMGSSGTNGQSLGFNKSFTFSGSGELDNGYAWSYYYATNEQIAAMTSAQVSFNLDSMGTLDLNAGAGSPVSSKDDISPSAWEESWDGTAGGANNVGGISGGTQITWTSPADLLPLGTSLQLAYGNENAGHEGDKGAGAGADATGSGHEIGITTSLGMDGLTIGAAYANIEQTDNTNYSGDQEEFVGYIKYAAGPITVSYQQNVEDPAVKSIGSVKYYETVAYGISFQVNDNLTVSYAEHNNEKAYGAGTTFDMIDGATSSVSQDSSGINVAYNLGGATLKISHNETDNVSYTSTKTKERTSVALVLAF